MARGKVYWGGQLQTVHAVPHWTQWMVHLGRRLRWLAGGRQGGHSWLGHYALLYCGKLELFNGNRLAGLLCTSTRII